MIHPKSNTAKKIFFVKKGNITVDILKIMYNINSLLN